MKYPKLIDNQRVTLAEVLREIVPSHKHLSIATGYWDIHGTAELIDELSSYESIRLIIGHEPMYNSYLKNTNLKLDIEKLQSDFPESLFKADFENIPSDVKNEKIRQTVSKLSDLISKGVLKVKVFQKPMLHAKAYIFGNYSDSNAVGVVGSSNFTLAGLTGNAELNSLEDDFRIVTFKPMSENHDNGHLSWFDFFWNHADAKDWTGDFSTLISDSKFGELTFSPYEVYIKSLMEIYSDELDPPIVLSKEIKDVLYIFQNRNAGILINKLNRMGIALLSDSVGLGKTITAGAVIKHYLESASGKANIQIITPASLKQQWIDDLSSVLGVDYLDGAYNIISQQDINSLEKLHQEYQKEWRRTKSIDLFVIDEAHNLRSQKGKRYEVILKLLQQHPNSHILMLTATPINNALLDIVNLIQLASKGSTKSLPVSYIRPNGKETERIDFYEAIKRIQSAINKSKSSEEAEKILERVKPTIHEGLRHYLVRSTRQGVEAEGSILDKNGELRAFPNSAIESINYEYNQKITDHVHEQIKFNCEEFFESIDPTTINLTLISEFTQQSSHPLDFIKRIMNDSSLIPEIFDIDNSILIHNSIKLEESERKLVPNILQIIRMLGFTAYRPHIYKHSYYGKNIPIIRSLDKLPFEVSVQLTIHNILHVTWLKRLESSPYALLISIKNYRTRLNKLLNYLKQGYIVTFSNLAILESIYNDGEDIERAFSDYDIFLENKIDTSLRNTDSQDYVTRGIEKVLADSKIYNVEQYERDLIRDLKILELLENLLREVSLPENDIKMIKLKDNIVSVLNSGVYGKKVLVFSFFADTIDYLKKNLHQMMLPFNSNFLNEAEFITGQTAKAEEIVRRFSPASKKYTLAPTEYELNYLFATDVLSEGQNLQDSGYLINYDLHWNPVRMIQRNGRINRIGSKYKEVLIANMKPTSELEMYLNLVYRLESKIKTIRNTIGLDQSVLSRSDINPIQFIEKYYQNGELPEVDDQFLAHTDEHVIELRKFLGENKDNIHVIDRVRNMPLGKWNYLSSRINQGKKIISLTRVQGYTVKSRRFFEDKFFIEVELAQGEYVASYIDFTKALDILRTQKDDNLRQIDSITYDRVTVYMRSTGEAKRQTNNPESRYIIMPRYLTALTIIADYLLDLGKIDIKGIIENGVNKINIQSDLELVLRKVIKEQSEVGSISVDTVNKFRNVLMTIINLQQEEKEIINTDVVFTSVNQ